MASAREVDRRRFLAVAGAGLGALVAGCAGAALPRPEAAPARPPVPTLASPRARSAGQGSAHPPAPEPAVIAARATVPVLCWHQLRDWQPGDAGYARRLLICPPHRFRDQLDALASAGYTTITPDQYREHLLTGRELPARPVLLSFDDSQGSQITEGLPQLRRRSMTATFFAMTVVLDKPGWMSRDDLRRLDHAGMTVAAHTWDHHRADQYGPGDYRVQFDQPRELLEAVLRKPVHHFAYPYGAWARSDFEPLRAAGYRTAFQLSDLAMDPHAPLSTLRRLLVNSTWSGAELLAQLQPRPA